MSPIGRVFIILNLALAGAFVAFTGLYLKRADNFREKHSAEVKAHAAESAALTGELAELRAQHNDAVRQADNADGLARNLKTEKERLTKENQDLEARLSTVRANYQTMESHLSTLKGNVAKAYELGNSAMERAIAAEAAKDEALAAKEKADAGLAESNFSWKNTEQALGEAKGQVAILERKVNERDVLLASLKTTAGGLFTDIQPLVTGTVSVVGKGFITIAVESGGENLKPGHRFAIYDQQKYKGEATVRDWDSTKSYAYARITLRDGDNVVFLQGDRASTNLNTGGSK